MREIGGVNVAAVTPQREQGHQPDLDALLDLVNYLAGAGVQGISLLGSTGEFLHLTLEDRARLVSLAVKRSKIPIVAGVSHSTLNGALHLAREAAGAGAAALLVMPPYFFRYSQEDIQAFYMHFAKELGKATPIFLYNVPAFSNELSCDSALDLLATGCFAGIKDSSGDLTYFERLRQRRATHAFRLLIGQDRIYTHARQAGADGVVSGVACAIPELMVGLEQALLNGRQEQVRRLEQRLTEFLNWIDQFPAPAGIKEATAARGIRVGPLAVPLAENNRKRLDEFRSWFLEWLPQVRKEAS